MKKLIYLIATVGVALSLESCSVGRYANNSSNTNLNQTQVVLSEANFKVVKSVQANCVYEQSTYRFKPEQLKQSAYAALVKEAKLTGAQALINVNIELLERAKSNKHTYAVIATGTVIEFTK